MSGVSLPAHTPGPWEARRAVQPDNVGGYDYAIIAPGKVILAEAFEIVGDGDARPVEANARLIAAAPDQLAALLALVERFNRFLSSDRNQADAYNCLVKGAFPDWSHAVAAIEKATSPSAHDTAERQPEPREESKP